MGSDLSVSGQSFIYAIVNAAGAAFILVSLYFNFNLSAVIIESFWLVFSLMGAFLALRKTEVPPP